MRSENLKQVVLDALDDGKAREVICLDVVNQTDITDFMVIASGTSSTHVKAVAERVVSALNDKGVKPVGVEGMEGREWILLDFADIVVHVMMPKVREFYDLERLWSVGPRRTESLV